MRVILTKVFLFLSIFSYGQTSNCNNNSSGEISVGTTCSFTTFNSSNNSNYWNSASGCGSGDDDDAWGWFTATGTSTTITYSPDAGYDAILHLFTGGCSTSMTALDCADNNGSGAEETITFATTVGVVYRIRIQEYYSNDNMFGDICIFSTTSPTTNPNDCGSAIDLSTLTAPYTNSTAGATDNFNVCGGGVDHIYYMDVPVGFTFSMNQTANSYDSQHSLSYGGSCPGSTLIDCIDDGDTDPISWQNCTGAIQRVYWIQDAYSSGSGSYTITWSLTAGACATPPANDLCANATNLPCGTTNLAGSTNATSNIAHGTSCSISNYGVWYSFVGDGQISNITTNPSFDIELSINSGTCGSLSSIGCIDSSPESSSFLAQLGVTYYIYVAHYASGSTTTGNFTISRTCSAPTANDECSGATPFPVIPTNGTCSNLLNQTNAFSSNSNVVPTGACTSNSGTPNDDVWFSFVATSSITYLEATYVSGTTNIYWQVFSGSCAATMTSLLCTDNNSGGTINGLNIGDTYYIRMYTFSSTSTSTVQDICLHNPIPGGAGCVGSTTVGSLPYNQTGFNTSGSGDDFSSADVCGSSYMNGDDFVFDYTPTSDECIEVILSNTGTYTGVFITDLCPDDIFSGCIESSTSSTGNPSISNASLIGGTTYYITVSTYPSPQTTAFDIEINTVTCPVPPNNDDCVGAISFPPIPFGGNCATLSNQTNSLATNSFVTPTGVCTSNSGTPDDDVWFSFVASETTLHLESTYISGTSNINWQVFSSNCGSSMTSVFCTGTDNGGTMTGLIVGNTYYIRMYTFSNNVAPTTQTICIHGDPPPTPGQDCETPLIVCSPNMSIGNPGYTGTGTINDFTGTDNCTGGEKNSLWLQINIALPGSLNFTIMPNDGSNNSNGAETDYDFLLWKMSGSGTTTDCATIGTSSSTALAACNYISYGVTGVAPGGIAPNPIDSYFDDAFEPTVNVSAGDVYYLVIQNFSGSTQGFDLDFGNSGLGVVDYTPPTTVYWTGGSDNSWVDFNNWGNCSVFPICGIDAIVTGGVTNQPNLGTGTQYVNDITINPNATLTIANGGNLHVCGDFTNYGNIVFGNNSTITFDGANTIQNIYGNCTGINDFGNFVINKTGGEVVLNCNIEIAQDFSNTNNTSILNTNGYDVTIGRHFSNFNGNTTYTNAASNGTLIFDGTVNQNYHQGASQLDLNNVKMINTSTGSTLLTNMYIKTGSGILNLMDGNIRTNSFEVFVQNDATNAIINNSSDSYIFGNLRRNIQSLGSYNFPVGNLTTFYQLANIDFVVPTSINNLLARFDPYPGAITAQGGSECLTTYNIPSEDNGYWTITADANSSTGTYNMTLYPTNATNTAGANGWTITKKANIGAPTWLLNGGCDWTSTALIVKRKNMSGFSVFGAAQATIVLPSELIDFSGEIQGSNNVLKWSTASEINNDYFNLLHSSDGINFEKIAEIDGAGNSTETILYESIDYSPTDLSYYRLEMVDFNESKQYSNIIRLNRDNSQVELINLYPNPSTNLVNFEINSPNKGNLTIQLFDYTGKLVKNEYANLYKGMNKYTLEITNLAKGIYNLRMTNEDKSFYETVKLIKE